MILYCKCKCKQQQLFCENLKFIDSGFGKSSDEQVIRQQKVHFYPNTQGPLLKGHGYLILVGKNDWDSCALLVPKKALKKLPLHDIFV